MTKQVVLSIAIMLCGVAAIAGDHKDPNIQIAQRDVSKVTLSQVLMYPELTDQNSKFRVTAFVISIYPKTAEPYGPFHVKGNRIPDHVLERLKTLSNKPINIVIEEVHAEELTDHVPRNLNSIFLKYK